MKAIEEVDSRERSMTPVDFYPSRAGSTSKGRRLPVCVCVTGCVCVFYSSNTLTIICVCNTELIHTVSQTESFAVTALYITTHRRHAQTCKCECV
jgi:hypothetical protein